MTGPVVVLGGAGYIGTALCEYLRGMGLGVRSIDLEWFGNPGNARNFRLDVASPRVDPALEAAAAVVLLAGHSSVPLCMADRWGSFVNNVQSFVRLLDRLPARTPLLYASSAGVYGGLRGKSCAEDEALPEPVTTYDVQKREIDMYAELARRAGRPLWGLRFGTVNGFSTHLRVDVMLNQMVHAAQTTGAILAANPAVSRPILGLTDLCRAVHRILTADHSPGLYNLASFNAPVQALAETAAARCGVPLVWGAPTPSYDMQLDCGKFETTFHFGFHDRPEPLVHQLLRHWEGATLTHRRELPCPI